MTENAFTQELNNRDQATIDSIDMTELGKYIETLGTTTIAGDKIAARLSKAIGTTRAIRVTCAKIHRLAVTYAHIQERWCNEDFSDRPRREAYLLAREANIEARIRDHVANLPATDDGPWSVVFGGDPRGNTVGIVGPGEWARACADNWDQERVGCDN